MRDAMTPDMQKELLLSELADIYDAEKQLVAALPKMAQAANNPELKAAFEQHANETREQVQRLEGVFTQLGKRPKNKSCRVMKALIAEGNALIQRGGEPQVLDAALIGAAQRVEHYEIAVYDIARAIAALAGDGQVSQTLELTLAEEHATDEKLSELAESIVNVRAVQGRAQDMPVGAYAGALH
jgi:ferritin-like metal-binding protein YciE